MANPGSGGATTIVWFRQDLRIGDNAALAAAAALGPVLPVFIRETTEGIRPPGGARRWWLHHSLENLGRDLAALGSRLVLASGDPFLVLVDLAARTGARRIFWNRRYEPAAIRADAETRSRLSDEGFEVKSFGGWLLHEPTKLRTKAGGPYQVFTPFWRALEEAHQFRAPVSAPTRLVAPDADIPSEVLDAWALLPPERNRAGGLRQEWQPGEAGAQRRLAAFLVSGLNGYAERRDFPGLDVTSRLSPHLIHGEITPAQVFAALDKARTGSAADRAAFRRQIGWREFSWHLLVNEPDLPKRSHTPKFDAFPWIDDPAPETAWREGMTGYPIIDAGMRQLRLTGFMHNRVRMIVASFLTKHLLTDWRRGEAWFWDMLVDADPASNAVNWQWVAGGGADAAPYFRIFNPVLQGEKFDPTGTYIRAYVPELKKLPDRVLHQPWMAGREILAEAGVELGVTYPQPIVDQQRGRDRALSAYETLFSSPD